MCDDLPNPMQGKILSKCTSTLSTIVNDEGNCKLEVKVGETDNFVLMTIRDPYNLNY